MAHVQCVTCGNIELASEMVAVSPSLSFLAEDAPRLMPQRGAAAHRYIFRRIGKMEYPQPVSWACPGCATDKDIDKLEADWQHFQQAKLADAGIEQRASEAIA